MGRSGKVNTRVPALLKQHALHAAMVADERFGVEDNEGLFAVLVNANSKGPHKEYETAGVHALQVADRETALRGAKRVLLVENPSTQEALDVIADPHVSSLAFIGHGSLGSFKTWNQDEKQMGWLSWPHLLPAIDCLKTGTVEQRTCSGLDKFSRVRMPLGTFIVADQTRITTLPPGIKLDNTVGFDGFNSMLTHPFPSAQSSIAELMEQTGHSMDTFFPNAS